MRVHSARFTQCTHVSLRKLKTTQNLACPQRQIHTVHTCKLSQVKNYQRTSVTDTSGTHTISRVKRTTKTTKTGPQALCMYTQTVSPKLQALVYDILPSTTAVFSYAIGSRKLSANEQFFFCWCSNSSKFVTTNSKHWFTTSFLQPLPYLVTP